MVKTSKFRDPNVLKKKIDAFKVLKDEEFLKLNDKRVDVLFNKGEIIFKQGTTYTHTICILEGFVKVYLESDGKKNFILNFLGPGEMIGVPGMFTDGFHHFSIASVDETLACFINEEVIEEIILSNGLFAIEMLKRAYLRDIRHYEKFYSLTQKQMPGRVAEAIIYLYRHIYHKSNPFILTITRQDMADMAAITKESMIRILKDFKDEKIISLNKNELKILNLKALESIAENG